MPENAPPVSDRSGRVHRGVWLALLAAALFGASAPAAKLLLRGTSPQLLAGLLYVGSGTGLLALWLWRRRRATDGGEREAPLSRRDLPWLAGGIAAGGLVAPVLLMFGLARTPASTASLLLNLEGVLSATIAWVIFRENVDRRVAAGFLAIILGGVVLSWQGDAAPGGFVGPLAIAGACLGWALDNNLTQKVSSGDPVQIAMVKGLVAGAVNTSIALAMGASMPGLPRVASAMTLGFLSYGVSLVLFVLALRALGTARTSAYFSVAPFVGAALSLIVFRETPSVALLSGGALMAVGVWLHVTERHEHEHAHKPMEHAHAHVHDEHHRHEHLPGDPPVTDPAPHSHPHRHEPLVHSHRHYPDIHHRHDHD